MGVDLYGNSGEKFRNNWWWWRPLATYCFEVAPAICESSRHYRRWMTNDGSMTAEEARQLAEILQAQIDSGATKLYQRARQARLEALPDEPCTLCNGTGRRSPLEDLTSHRQALKMAETHAKEFGIDDELIRIMRADYVKRALVDPDPVECPRCNGYRAVRPSETEYPFEVENIQTFVNFLKICDGFEVH